MPRRRFSLALLLPLLAACAPSAPPPDAPAPAAERDASAVAEEVVSAETLQDHISFLASDAMRGRDTPSPELEEAADYLAGRFEELGLEGAGDGGTFIQRWPFRRLALDENASTALYRVDGSERTWRYGVEYFAVPGPDRPIDGTPVYVADPSLASDLPAEVRGRPLLASLPDGLGPAFGAVLQAGAQAGASGVVLIMDEESEASDIHQIAEALEAGAAGQLPFPVIGLRHDVGQELLRDAASDPTSARDPPELLEDVELSFRTVFEEAVDEVPNVVAMLPGSDPELSDTYVVVTAHFDHVGVGPPDETGDSIYSGADDNASGTAALVEAARALAAFPEAPARSVLFLAVSGEEKGLLGSAHFVESPTVPIDAVVANVNMDMVGRNHPDTVYGIGQEYTSLGAVADEVAAENPELGLVVAPDPEPEEQAFLRSDHYSFVQQEIPALMLTTWLHDDYHVPSDTPDKIDADKAARVTRLVSLLTHRIASDPEEPEWTAEGRQLLQSLPPSR